MGTDLKVIHSNLEKMLKEKSQALPKDFNQTRFLQNCMTVLNDLNIGKVQPITVVRTMLKGAFLGLDFFNKECYAIAYGDQLNFQTDYKGEIKLAKKYSINPIKDIYAKLVRKDDFFQEKIIDGKQSIDFQPKSFSNSEIIGSFAVILFQDGSMIYDTMTTQEIEDIRNKFSKAKNSKAWADTWGEMAKKTVLRRLLKMVQLDFDNAEQDQAFDESENYNFKEKKVEKVQEENLLDDIIEDAEITEEKKIDEKIEDFNPFK